jgi:hypothetical protein
VLHHQVVETSVPHGRLSRLMSHGLYRQKGMVRSSTAGQQAQQVLPPRSGTTTKAMTQQPLPPQTGCFLAQLSTLYPFLVYQRAMARRRRDKKVMVPRKVPHPLTRGAVHRGYRRGQSRRQVLVTQWSQVWRYRWCARRMYSWPPGRRHYRRWRRGCWTQDRKKGCR